MLNFPNFILVTKMQEQIFCLILALVLLSHILKWYDLCLNFTKVIVISQKTEAENIYWIVIFFTRLKVSKANRNL